MTQQNDANVDNSSATASEVVADFTGIGDVIFKDAVPMNAPSKKDETSPEELARTFHDAKKVVKELIRDHELFLEEYENNRQTVREHFAMKGQMLNLDLIARLVMIGRYGDAKEVYEDNLRRLKRLWSFYHTSKKVNPDMITDADISRAKEVPVEKFLEVKRRRARCVWHSPDKHPSMYIYPDNHVHCFSCGKGGDVIAVYMALHGFDFKTAVKELCRL